MNYQQHPLSACFPSMPKEDFDDLVNDIGVNGQKVPIFLYEDQILDGWHRYKACLEARVKPNVRDFTGMGLGTDPVAFVRSMNWHRRHLTASQRAAVIVDLRKWKPAHREKNSAPGADLTVSTVEMAKEAGVGTRTIEQAKTVAANGTEKLKQDVKDGKISVKKAAEKVTGKKSAAKPADKPKAPEPDPTVPLKQYQTLEEKYQELIEELETVTALRESDPAKAMNTLRESLRIANRRRDELMVQCKEKQKQIDYYKRELSKLGWKPKK